MEAPDKIYLYREKPKDYFDDDWHESPASDVENVEYIRKETILEILYDSERCLDPCEANTIETIIGKINLL